MGGFGGVLRGLTTAATGVEQGLANRAELERQARLQLLAQRLQDAQINNLNSEVANRGKPKPPPPPGYVVHINDDGTVDYIPKAPPQAPGTVITTPGASIANPTGQPPQQPGGIVHGGRVAPKPKKPVTTPLGRAAASVVGQETQAAARNALAALDQADAVLAKDPDADIYPVGSAIAEGAGKIPIIGGALAGAMGPAAQAQMRPTQQQYQQAMDQFLHNYSALLPKGGRSVTILQTLRNSFTPRAGQTDRQVRASFRRAREGLRRQLQALAGGQNAGSLPGVVPQAAPASSAPASGGAAAPPINWTKWQ